MSARIVVNLEHGLAGSAIDRAPDGGVWLSLWQASEVVIVKLSLPSLQVLCLTLAKDLAATAAPAAEHTHPFRRAHLKKITILSSSMVYENATAFPTPEGHQRQCPPPSSTYGFQKLAGEYFAHGAWEQDELPYTICRPFNCVGIGERRPLGGPDVPSGNIRLAMTHVVPDLVQKILRGQDPLHILGSGNQIRCYTYGGDLARGIAEAIANPEAGNEDFNLSTSTATTVLELAEAIWSKIHGKKRTLRIVSDPPFPHDVQRRVPDVTKAKRVLGFEAATPLDVMLDEVIPWIRDEISRGNI
jgi:nucleoside-diphosphate-sugar epimerase